MVDTFYPKTLGFVEPELASVEELLTLADVMHSITHNKRLRLDKVAEDDFQSDQCPENYWR